MFKNLKLSHKLIGGFGIVLILLTGIVGLYQYTIKTTTGNFQSLIEIDLAIANHASQVESLMLQCRRNEKDFLLRIDHFFLILAS